MSTEPSDPAGSPESRSPPAPAQGDLCAHPPQLSPCLQGAPSQVPAGVLSTVGQSGYTFQGPQDGTLHMLYPKPIYSYSILIFMALRSSQTGSLPVSEIYSFMTEHFPYFKTAPDGWKNSVRHNLSLNKCFEKVENKAGGGSSRKGCLWALNPARVEKMQEELHKWRRKDPLTVRKSMARPEELCRLLGERPEGPMPSPAHSSLPHSPRQPQVPRAPGFDPPAYTFRHSLQNPTPSLAMGPRPHYLPPSPLPFTYSSPPPQLSCGVPPLTGSQDSPLPAQTPPAYSATLQAEHCAPRSMQELLMEGELCNDIDTLNPSLTDLQLQDNLWEELRDDSLTPDTLQLISPSPCSPPSPPAALQCPSLWDGCPMGVGPAADEAGMSGVREEGAGHLSNLHITGLYSTAFTNLEGVTSYLPTTGNAPITLL
ncbi:forkhead box protein N1 [Megalops cyprinoides]|uniref:forkhead box protein N1 n=1 Tax=Megalops cyprinoides TaxID=118141 RepID=UPI0018644E33|nr:forkhead box protein N1 [Megalops cyprinoides]